MFLFFKKLNNRKKVCPLTRRQGTSPLEARRFGAVRCHGAKGFLKGWEQPFKNLLILMIPFRNLSGVLNHNLFERHLIPCGTRNLI